MSHLYIVATPIGNLEDITLRAIRTLKEVSVVACEDTRVTRRLLAHYEITTPTVSYHQHSSQRVIDDLIERLGQGQSVAVVTDAGTPGISDPGNQLVAAAVAAGIPVVPIPGANAIGALLSVAGVATDEFLFVGFIPHKKGRQTLLKQIASESRPVIFYESCHRLIKTLEQLVDFAPQHRVIIGRELTKVYEEVFRGTPATALEHFNKQTVRGEVVVLLSQPQ